MNGFRREQVEGRNLLVNQGVIEDALDAIIYKPRYSCTYLVAGGGAAFGNVAAAEYLAYPNAGTPTGRMSMPTPTAHWINGQLTVRLIWSGDTASTNPVQWGVGLTITAAGGVPTSISAAADLPGPGTINALLDNTLAIVPPVWPINSSHILLGMNIFRNAGAAGDTYAGEARLFGFQIIYTPVAGH